MTRRWGWLLAIAALLAACDPRTELVVVAQSDLSIPDELDEVVFEVVGPSGEAQERTAPLTGQDAVTLPVTLVLLRDDGPLGPVTIRVTGRLDGADVVRHEVIADFVERRSVRVIVELTRACLDVLCEAGETCVDGGCVGAPRIGPDAGAPSDDAGLVCTSGCACVQSCEGGCECNAGCDCQLYCGAGADCTSGKCKDEGTTCTLSARGAANVSHTCESGARCVIDARGVSNVDRVTCKSSASCDVDCGGASNCHVDCEGDAQCLVACDGASNCTVSDCGEVGAGDLLDCGGGVLACRRACP